MPQTGQTWPIGNCHCVCILPGASCNGNPENSRLIPPGKTEQKTAMQLVERSGVHQNMLDRIVIVTFVLLFKDRRLAYS